MLKIQNLHAYYGKSHVLHGVDFEVRSGEIVALLGRNGSGRSTTAKAIMGLVDCEGSVRWKNQEIVGRKAYEVAHLGLGYVPESRDIFPTLTVHQNLLLGQKGAGKGSRVRRASTSGAMPGPLSMKRIQARGAPGPGAQSTSMRRRGSAVSRSARMAFLVRVHSTRYSRSRRPGRRKSCRSSVLTQWRSRSSKGYSSTSEPSRLAALTVCGAAPG